MSRRETEAYLARLTRALIERGVIDRRIVDEARDHIEDAVERNLRDGMTAEAAEQEALAGFGSAETVATDFATGRYVRLNRVLLVVAVVTGLGIATVDAHHTWDDAGITAGTLVITAAIFGAIGPRRPWLWALAVGMWIPVHAFLRTGALHELAFLVLLVFPFVGAYAGMAVRRMLSAS